MSKKKARKVVTPPPPPPENKKINPEIILAILVAIGAFLRIFELGTEPLWLDEASTLTFARDTLFGVWNSMMAGEFNPPVFYWIEHFVLFFGQSEFTLRMVPALFGIAAIPVFYFIGKEIRDENTGLVCAALVSFSSFAISYSQEARAYILMLFFVALSLWMLLRFIRTRSTNDAVFLGLVSAAAIWVHFYAAIPIAIILLVAFIDGFKEKYFDKAEVAVGVFSLFSFPIILAAFGLFLKRTSGGATFGIQGMDVFSQTAIQLSGSDWLSVPMALLATGGIILLFISDAKQKKALILAALLIIPITVSILLSYSMPMVPRYLIYLQVPLFAGVASFITLALEKFKKPQYVYIIIALILIINIPFLYGYYTTQQKDDWRGVANRVGDMAGPGDVILTIPGYVRFPFNYYYDNSTHGTLEYAPYSVGEIERIISSHPGKTFWFVVTGDVGSIDPSGNIVNWLQQNTQIVWYDKNSGIILGVIET